MEDFSAGTNKKSVKFEDPSESKIKIYDESRFMGSDYPPSQKKY